MSATPTPWWYDTIECWNCGSEGYYLWRLKCCSRCGRIYCGRCQSEHETQCWKVESDTEALEL